jgi:ABC-type lipoprotein release transport system permease subunit
MTAVGSTIGLVVALPLPRVFDAMFPDLHTGARILYVMVLLGMLMVAAFATYIPAQRAAHISPIAVLRSQ